MGKVYYDKGAYIFMLLIIVSFFSCKKEKVKPDNVEEIVSPTTGTRTQFTLDSIYLYAKQLYLWNDALPSYAVFNPRSKYAAYSVDLTAFRKELFDISQLKINPLTGKPYENPLYTGTAKYSYLETGAKGGRSALAEITAHHTSNNPVLATAIFDVGTSKVGYVALSSFPKLSAAQVDLDAAFSYLAASGTTNLVVDLRLNGGGYVETAEYIANLIAPKTLNGKVMYTEQFNKQMQEGKALILRHQPYLDENNKPVIYKGRVATMADVDFTEAGNTHFFKKSGGLETVTHLYFIVSASTASASEQLINCLKPYFNVKLVGSKTYGKPVGFFGVIIDKYTLYLSGFLIKNARGSADYFNGMESDIPAEPDNQYGLGNPSEDCLSKVLTDIQTRVALVTGNKDGNSLKIITKRMAVHNTGSVDVIIREMNGLIEQRMKLKQ